MVSTIANAVLEGKALRKDEEAVVSDDKNTPAVEANMDDDEMSDEDLLGASTLEKIKQQPEAEESESVEETNEEATE
jgi:hypothetical protein